MSPGRKTSKKKNLLRLLSRNLIREVIKGRVAIWGTLLLLAGRLEKGEVEKKKDWLPSNRQGTGERPSQQAPSGARENKEENSSPAGFTP